MRLIVLVLAAATVVAGCVAPGTTLDTQAAGDVPFDDLASDALEKLVNDDGTVTLVFEATTSAGVGAFGFTRQLAEQGGKYEVDSRVGFVEAAISYSGEGSLAAVVLDDDGRIQCAAFPDGACTVPVPEDLAAAVEWRVVGRPIFGAVPPDVPFTMTVTLHPPSHITRGDPLAGVDPTITFRVSDTGVPGGEDNIGVLGDGTIFTTKNTAVMRSTDDGETWTNVAPPGNDRITLDPMLFVDPWRGTVYVDHLYVGCSTLSWSKDAGETWITNPLACGIPSNDHQKVASGPGLLPGTSMVYYSFSHIGLGNVWASRSVDGGLTWTSSPVEMPRDETDPSNTGHIYADEHGNVYVPLYMCEGDGYMAVGVSHDRGLTWKLVRASEQPGECYDPDPGLWSDIAGNVYLAYHRPDGVYYVASTDFGETWGAPVKLSPDSLKSFVHVDAIAGDEGRLAVVYRATPDSAKGPDLADGWAAWHLYVTFVENATSETPTIRTGIVNDPSDPIQRGPLCTGGISCYGGSRNLLDFIDIGVGPDGRVYPTFSDGCDKVCVTPADSRGELGPVGIQLTGPRLFVDRAPWAK